MSDNWNTELSPDASDDLWQAYWRRQETVIRDKLIERYRSLVEKLAGYHYARRIEDDVDYEDFVQLGYAGLIESIHRYKPNSNAGFETFASYRVKGSILNGLAKMSEKREQIEYRNRVRKERLKSLAGRDTGVNKTDVFDELVDVALGLAVGFMLEDASLVENEEKGVLDGGYSSAQYSSVRSSLVSQVELLPENEKLVVYYHYFQGLKFDEVASSIGLSKGRVSQLHKKALATLKVSLCSDVSLDGYL